jgi:hypothetical protein
VSTPAGAQNVLDLSAHWSAAIGALVGPGRAQEGAGREPGRNPGGLAALFGGTRAAAYVVDGCGRCIPDRLFYAGFPVHALTTLGWEVGTLGGFFSVLAAFMLPSQGPLLAFATRHLSPRAIFQLGAVALALSYVCFFSTHTAVLYLAAALYAVGNGLAWPTFQACIANAAGDADQGVG